MKSAEDYLREKYPLLVSEFENSLPDYIGTNEALKYMQEYVEYAAQQKSEWVPCETDLPNEHRKVLFLTDNVLFPDNSYTGTYVQGKWYVSGNYRPVEANVTYWMYIPSPPKK